MIDESELEKAIRALNLKWLQADRKYRWMLADEDCEIAKLSDPN